MFVVLSILLLLHHSQCFNPQNTLTEEVFAYHEETSQKAEMSYEIVNKIYTAFRQWFFTVIFCEFTYFENRILKYIENYDYGYPVILLNSCPSTNKTKVKPRINIHGETAYIVSSDEMSADVNEDVLEALLRTGVFKPMSAVIFVINVPVQIDSYFNFAMKNHFQLLWSRSITNSVLVIWSDRLKMFTYNPFRDVVEEITYVTDISRLLSRQYHNLYGHELRLSVFRKIFVSNEQGPVNCNSRLAQTVMNYLNATCKPLPPRDGNTVGDLLENGTATGVTADLIDGYTDLELSSRILKNSYYGYIGTTYPLTQDELCILIKKSDKQSTFMTTLKLIRTEMLILFFFNVIFMIAISLWIRRIEIKLWNVDDNDTYGKTIMDLVKCFLRQTVDIKFMGPIFRAVVMIIILYSLVIDCVIDGILTSAITYPRYKPDINTIPELAKMNIIIGVHNRHMKIFNNSLSKEYHQLLENKIEIFNDQKIKDVIEKRDYRYATLLRKSDAHYISRKVENMKQSRPLFHVMLECPVPCSIVYGLRYGSPYITRINYILHHLNQGGILQHWTRSEEYSLGKSLYGNENQERKALNLDNLKEVFIVWIISLFISTICFIFEVLLYHTYYNYLTRNIN